jgi:hypothetical protein
VGAIGARRLQSKGVRLSGRAATVQGRYEGGDNRVGGGTTLDNLSYPLAGPFVAKGAMNNRGIPPPVLPIWSDPIP